MVFDPTEIVALYIDIIQVALPFVVIFWMCDFVVQVFLRAAFGGKLTFRQ